MPLITRQDIDEQQWVERYLADQLSEHEREQFESYYVEHPEILPELHAAATIGTGTALLRRSGELAQLTTSQRAWRWRPSLALAASLLILLIGGTYFLRPVTSLPAPLLATTRDALGEGLTMASYQVQRTRSDVDAVIALPASPQAIRLRLHTTAKSDVDRYRLDVLAVSQEGPSRKVATLGALRLDGAGLLTVFVNSARLMPGSYELQVFRMGGTDPSEPLSDFLVDVVAPTANPQ